MGSDGEDTLLKQAAELEAADQPSEALQRAWDALERDPNNLNAKRVIARLLRQNPTLIATHRRPDLERLLTDPDVDPDAVAPAAWILLLAERVIAPDADPEEMAATLEVDRLALSLLTEARLSVLDAERALTAVRSWLLRSGLPSDYPRLSQALIAQAALNCGAWPFDEEERALLRRTSETTFADAFVRSRADPSGETFGHSVTQSVADQYQRWPYPHWSRITSPAPTTLPLELEKLDGGRPSDLPIDAEILVAGCGTGREAAMLARRFPDSKITAIDISAASLAYATERCAGFEIDFKLLDLHDVVQLGRRFHHIACSGVLHHLPDPEAGWAKLVEVLEPGGVMKVMVYSRAARLRIAAAKLQIADLLGGLADDDLLREVRRRLIERMPDYVGGIPDFYNLDGVHDLFLNRHEDPFDVARITRALDRLGLELLAFKLPTKADEARYRRDHPDDPLYRDVTAWTDLEKTDPFLFAGMYEFWCRAA